MKPALCILFFTAGLVLVRAGIHVQGSIPLNEGIFDKIISRHKYVLVKFDEASPMGEKQDVYGEVAKFTIEQPDVLVGEVCVDEEADSNGLQENLKLAQRYDAGHRSDWPVYKLFVDGDALAYNGLHNAEAIKDWLVSTTRLWFGCDGCVKSLDELSVRAVTGEDTRAAAHDAAVFAPSHTATFYVKTVERIVERGGEFVSIELARLKRLGEGHISEEKKLQLRTRVRILENIQRQLLRDEL